MKINSIFIFFVAACVSFLGNCFEAKAFHEIGDFQNFGTEATNRVQDIINKGLTTVEDEYNKLNDKFNRGGPDGAPEGKGLVGKLKAEGKNVAKNAVQNGIDAVKSGNFNPADIAQNMLNGAQADLSRMTQEQMGEVMKKFSEVYDGARMELAQATSELEELEKAEKIEREGRIKNIESEILEKETALELLEDGSDLAFTLSKEIEDLKQQKQALIEETDETQSDETLAENEEEKQNGLKKAVGNVKKKADALKEKYASLKQDAQDKINAAKDKMDAALDTIKQVNAAKTFNAEVDKVMDKVNIFGSNDEQEAENLYAQIIQDFFLGEDEISNSANVSRIRQNRKRAYYQAVEDLFVAAVQADGAIWKAGEDAAKMRKIINEKAETNFGAKVMQLGIEVQTAKTAARLTRVMLAQMRMETMEHVQGWTTYDHMRDYSQDVTAFNLDNYIYDPSLMGRLKTKFNQGVKDLRKKAVQTGKQTIQGVQGQVGNQIGQINFGL